MKRKNCFSYMSQGYLTLHSVTMYGMVIWSMRIKSVLIPFDDREDFSNAKRIWRRARTLDLRIFLPLTKQFLEIFKHSDFVL